MKLSDLFEQGGVGRITKQNQTTDVGPNEIIKQAAKFGNKVNKDGYPPLLHSKAAKNSTPNKLSNLGLNEDSVADLRKAVIKQVNATNDAEMLDRIYTVLNKTNLQDRIQGVITQETDAKKYAKVIADIIINTPGTYKEKYDFINGYPDGYIDVEKLISGQTVNFRDLVTGGEFNKKVFDQLFAFRPETAGPGEFALAALSPRIKMRSKGDLYIDGDYIEVKASAGETESSGGGRLGEPGLLNPNGVKELIEKYIKREITGDVYIHQLHGLLSSALKDPKEIKKAAAEILTLIFGHNHVDQDVINAVATGNNEQQAYLAANWRKYKNEAGWAGLLIINRAAQSARLYTSPEQTADSIYSIKAAIVSKDVAKASRQILSQVTLKTSEGRGRSAKPATTKDKVDQEPATAAPASDVSVKKPSRGERAKRSDWHKAYKDQPPAAGAGRKKRD